MAFRAGRVRGGVVEKAHVELVRGAGAERHVGRQLVGGRRAAQAGRQRLVQLEHVHISRGLSRKIVFFFLSFYLFLDVARPGGQVTAVLRGNAVMVVAAAVRCCRQPVVPDDGTSRRTTTEENVAYSHGTA